MALPTHRFRPLALLAVLLAAPTVWSAGARAQTLVVTSTAPADFAAAVPLVTEFRFTFSEPLAAVPALVVLPDSAVALGATTLSADGRTAVYPVTLQPETRYVALLPTAVAASGARLARPAALNVTTAAQAGPLTVRGTVSDPTGAAVDGALVALVTADVATGAVRLMAVRVLSSASPSQAYTLGPVPLAVYGAAALRLPGVLFDPASTAAPAVGFYDANGDGTPDPILVPFGVDVALGPLPAATAGADAEAAAASAADAVPGATLESIPPRTVDAAGGSPFWTYTFAAGSERVTVVQLGPVSLPVPDAVGAPAGPALPLPFVDSDAAVATADGAGGAAFRALHAGRAVAVAMGTLAPPETPVAVWRLDYTARDGAGALAGRFTADVDLVTGAVLATTAAAPAPHAAVRLAVDGANPARGARRLRVAMPAAGPAHVAVVDAVGRMVAVLWDGPLAAGETALPWPAAVAPGLYWVRLDAAGQRAVVPVTVVR